MIGWVARRWANTARPVLVKLDKPRGFLFNRRPLKAGEVRYCPVNERDWSIFFWCTSPWIFYTFCMFYYFPDDRMDIWANHAAYAEVLKEDEEWAERRKEYNLDMYPRHIWQDNVSVNNSNATFSLEEPWPGTNTEPIKPKKGAFDRAKEMVQNAFRK